MLLEAGNELNTTKQLHKIQRFGEIPVVSYTTEDVDQLSQVNSANAENLCFSREAAQHKEAIPSRINGIAAPSASLTV